MRLRLAGVGLACLAAVGCAVTGEEASGPSGEASSPAPSSKTDEDFALDSYQSMWSVLVDEARSQDPDYSGLEDYVTGEALALVEHGLFAEADEGVVARGAPVLTPEVVSEEDDRVEIEDCMDSSDWLREDSRTGDLVEPSPEEPLLRKIDATVTFDGLSWKVAELQIWEIGSCDV